MNNKLIYQGKISVKLKVKDKIFNLNTHNEGSVTLFKMFAKILAGEDITQDEKPYVIDLQALNGEIWTSCLTNKLIPNKFYTLDADSDWVTILNTSITPSNIISIVGSSFRIVLLNKLNNELATAPIEDTLLEKVLQGSQALVEWSLGVKNAN